MLEGPGTRSKTLPKLGVEKFFSRFYEIDPEFSAEKMQNLILNRMVPVKNSRKHVILRRSRLNAKKFLKMRFPRRLRKIT